MIDDSLTEFHHLSLQINQERQQSNVFHEVGHISAIDPTTNSIKVVIPTWTNDNKNYMETGWIPLGTMVAGNQYGIQLLPFGQATVTDPSAQSASQNGNTPMTEQTLVNVLGRKRGLYIAGVQTFNTQDVPPSGYQDPSGVQAKAGEWLFKHASGTYTYYSNGGTLTLESFTNPAPVLQTDQTPDSVDQTLNFKATAVGTNSNKNGNTPATVSSNINVTSAASGGNTNNATLAEKITSDKNGQAKKTTGITSDSGQGTTEYTITLDGNESTMSITVTGNTNTYNLSVPNGTVNINAKTINIVGTETTTITGGHDTIVLGA